MSHAISQVKPPHKARQVITIAIIVACVLGIFTLFALSSTTARPSTLEADPFGNVDEATPLAPSQSSRVPPFHRDPDAPGRRF